MATWEDGPEYAPVERPDHFADAGVGPLEQAPPYEQSAASAPDSRPRFRDPDAPVAPLASLVPAEGPQRDPALPFDVATGTMTTTDSAWSAAHWSRPGTPAPSVVIPPAPPPGQWPQPLPNPTQPVPTQPVPTHPVPTQPVPTQALAAGTGPAVANGGFPAPGTPQWFAPAPYGPPPPSAPAPVTVQRVIAAATPGLCICLAIGGVFSFLAPLTLLIAFGLSSRVTVAEVGVRRTFRIGTGALSFFALIAGLSTLANGDGFSAWWSATGLWALLISWVVLVVTLALVAHGLKAGRPPAGRWP
jgi:hypothetical protein